jgi:hypothetical protein
MNYNDPHLISNEKTQPIHWIEWLISALMIASSLWLVGRTKYLVTKHFFEFEKQCLMPHLIILQL